MSAQNLRIFSICVQNIENGFLCSNSILGSKSVLFALITVSISVIFIDDSQKNIKIRETAKNCKAVEYKRNK